MPPGIYLAGDYFAHAGIEAAIFSGELAANRLNDDHRTGAVPVAAPAAGS
jgi:oxygen-dependent protoporphyrinogen oxidase